VPGRSFSLQDTLHVALAAFILLCALVPKSIHAPEPIGRSSLQSAEAPASALESREGAPSFLPLNTPHAPQAQAVATVFAKVAPPLPLAAIIIDDMGYNREIGRQLLDLGFPLSFSFLPQAPHTTELARLAHERGRTVLVHLPMEPKDHRWKMEPLMLKAGEDGELLREKTQKMLAAVPVAQGANTHMGSRFTERTREMEEVLSVLKEQHLFFIDSYTTAGSVAEARARQLRLPTARRRIFLDNEPTEAAICRQMALLAELAATDSGAIAIGHPNQAMFTALINCAKQLLSKVQLVGVEHLVHAAPQVEVFTSPDPDREREN